jgi:hypothetical protein
MSEPAEEMGPTSRGEGAAVETVAPPKRPPPSLVRRLARALGWMTLGLVALTLTAPFAAIELAETALARGWLRDAAREQGIELDYARLIARPFSGQLAIEGLRVATPETLAHGAPDLLSVRRLDARFSPSALLEGQLHLQRLEVEGVRMHLVVDAQGRDSLSLALAPLASDEEPSPSASAPASQALSAIRLPLALRADEVQLTGARFEHVQLFSDGHRRTVSVDGLELHGRLRQDRGPLEADLTLASPDRAAGTRVAVEEPGQSPERREADLALEVRASTSDPSTIALAAHAELIRQSFDEELALPRRALALRGTLRFEPETHRIALSVAELSALDGALQARVDGELFDGAALPRLRGGAGAVDLDALARALPASLGLISDGGRLRFDVRAEPGADVARVEVRGGAARVGASSPLSRLEVAEFALALDARLAPDRLQATLRAPASRVELRSLAGSVELADVTLSVDPLELASPRGGALAYDDLLAALGRARATLSCAALTARSDDVREARVPDVELEVRASLTGEPVWTPEATLRAGEARVLLTDGTRIDMEPSTLELGASDLTLDFARPARLRGELTSPAIEVARA